MIGVFGGSGFYEFLENAREVEVDTPYGPPAAPLTVGTVEGAEVAFLPRHGVDHQFPAHKVPFRANVWAMKEIGATCVIGPCAVGSLQAEIAPRSFVVCDQLFDATRADDIAKMLGENAAEFYGFDTEKLAPLVDRIGPKRSLFREDA